MLQTLVVGTKNMGKLREIRVLLKGVPLQVCSLSDFPDFPEVLENGKTFVSNAEKKARQYSKLTHALTLADDSGLIVTSLNGKPGVYSARFAGENCSYGDNNRKLLKMLSSKKRAAKFVCVIAIYDNGRRIRSVRGDCTGRIAIESRGKHGFGYDPIFIPRGFTKTFAELGPSTKNKISHRGKALRKAKKVILEYLG
jgi:XTP/dITP diphosphohydrolase